jgi:cell division GTPase FtsZ
MLDVFNIFALGQCGCRIAKEFDRLGFNTHYINSDVVDMRDFSVSSDKVLMLNTTGTGRSPAKGRQMLESSFDKFSSFMDKHLSSTDLNVFIIGLGGGTGGGMILPAIKYAKQKGFKVGVIATLPQRNNMLDMDNAMKGLKELREQDINMFILADNEYLTQHVGLSSDYWQKINYYILTKVVTAFDLLRENKSSQSGIGSIDKGELIRVLQYGRGLMDIKDVYFTVPDEIGLDDDAIRSKLFEPALIPGYDYKDTLFYLVSVDIPKKGGHTEFANKIFNLCKSKYGSALARVGMFNDPLLDRVIRVTIINAGLKLPKVIRSKINNLKRDSDRYETKKKKEDSLDFSDVDSVKLEDDFNIN